MSKTPLLKGQCWACWESLETKSNPLIRTCLGCKDPDLQFIHQLCIDQFINNLPTSSSGQTFQCSRCRDPYFVQVIHISPLTVLLGSKKLCTMILTFTAILLLIISFVILQLANASWNDFVVIGPVAISFPLLLSIFLAIICLGGISYSHRDSRLEFCFGLFIRSLTEKCCGCGVKLIIDAFSKFQDIPRVFFIYS
jgi:hypothetical protein